MNDKLLSLGAHVVSQQEALLLSVEPNESTRRALAERAARRNSRPRSHSRFVIAAAVASVALAAGLAFSAGMRFKNNQSLRFTVGHAARPGVLHAWESAPVNAELPIRFSDGTELRLGPEARAQVVRVGENGAEVVLDSGRALVDVVPRELGSWRVRSGPFTIAVKGTRFDVSWDPKADEFALRLFEGRVFVTGCSFGDGRMVEQGQSVTASCEGRTSALPAAGAGLEQASPEPSRATAPDTAPAAAATVESKSTAVSLARQVGESWQEMARGGHFQRAYALAASAGFEAEGQKASADDALMLGDAARLSGRSEHARLAYLNVRSRFPQSDAAARAAFALGRLAFDGGNASAAMPWFETYLAQRPSGPLAMAALDRLLEASLRLGDPERTRTIAAAYLARNPSGPHAKDARRILDRVEAKD